MIFTANADTLETLWPLALPHIERVADETLIASPDDILSDIREGLKQLWLCEQEGSVTGAIVTQVYETRRGSICCIWAASGVVGVEMLVPVFSDIEAWAREIGCVALEVKGRKGWKRVLPGFKETAICLEKDLRQVH